MEIIFFFIALASANADYYDTPTGKKISKSEFEERQRRNISSVCVTEVEPCKEDEFRSADGSCYNFLYPSFGTSFTPWKRLLPPYIHKATEPRETSDGRPLPLSRVAATTLLSKGRVSSLEFTTLLANYWLLPVPDMAFFRDSNVYVQFKPYCCKPEGKYDDQCAPNIIPPDDPVHRFSGIRCHNMTKPESLQYHGCLPKNTPIIRGTEATPVLDMSFMYGNTKKKMLEKFRSFSDGLAKTELINGYEWPPNMPDGHPWKPRCLNNVGEEKRICLDTPDVGVNALLGVLSLTILYWRQHNRLARELAFYNPCWDDEMLFNKARDINIALYLQIYYYELMPIILGRENLIRDGVIQDCSGFRDVYDDSLYPRVTHESLYVLRWGHLIQEGSLKLYDSDGYFTKRFPAGNATLRPGWFATGDNLAQVYQGSFRQACAAIDYVVDPDISDIGIGPMQKMLDIILNDHAKDAHFEFQPYIKYREYCSGKKITSFEDLRDVIDQERIEALMNLYEKVEDIELMSGLWVERPKKGSKVPDTIYCVTVEQMLHNLWSDRHWYERPTRPHAFTYEQLQEIRKASVAQLMCDYADFVTQIQPHPLLRAGPGNEIDDCDRTAQSICLSSFTDPSCDLE